MNNTPQESLASLIGNALHYFFKDFYSIIVGAMVSFFGYLLPIKNMVLLLILFFIGDVFFGFWAAKKLRNERFSVKIIWDHTMPRMFVSIVLITGAFLWDKEYQQDLVSTYRIIGWFVSGVLLFSIAENGYQITKWSVFTKLSDVLNENVKKKTGLELDDKNKTP